MSTSENNIRGPSASSRIPAGAAVVLCVLAILDGGDGVARAAAPESTGPVGLEEIIVSARKRQEALADIPGSVSVVSEELIRELGGLIDPLQLGELLPGLTVEDEGLPEYKARGAGVSTNNLADPSMVVLRNGVNVVGGFGGRTLSRIDQFDTRQVELYRGAQGSMFGRNAVGGVINVVNREPTEDFEWNALASLGFDKRQMRAEGVVNVPLVVDRLFMRTGVQYATEDGLYRNEFLGGPALPQESLGLRLGLRALLSESTDATLFVDWEDFENSRYIDSGTRRAGVEPETFLTVGAVDDRGQPLSASSGFPANSPYDEYRSAVDTAGFYRQRLLNSSLTINHSLPFATLQSVTNYRDRNFDTLVDGDGSYVGGPATTVPALRAGVLPAPNTTTNAVCVRTVTNAQRQFTSVTTARQCTNLFDTESSDFSQELRLLSSGDGALQWLAGVDYRDFRNPVLEIRDGRFANTTGAGTISNFLSDAVLTNRQHGAFLSAEVSFATRWSLAGSLRYSKERKALRLRVLQIDTTPAQLETAANERDDFESFDPTLTLSYEFGEHLLYMAAAKAERSGGYNRAAGIASAPAALAGVNVPLRYEDEQARTYELGFKGRFANRLLPFRYSLTVYQADYDDILRNAVVTAGGNSGDPDTVILGSQLVNIGEARVRGLDLELDGLLDNWLWSGGSLRWSLAYTLADSEILSGPATGQSLQDLPRTGYNANLLYRRTLRDRGDEGVGAFFASINGEYESPKTPSTSTVAVDPRRRLNARVGVDGDWNGKGWQLTLFIDNLLDFDDIVTRGNLNTYDGVASISRQLARRAEPRSFGVRFSMNSGRGGRGR